MTELLESKKFDLIAIGSSAGGIEALKGILTGLREPYGAAIVIVQHVAPMAPLSVAEFFQQYCALPVKEAEDKEPIMSGMVYFAPAGYHLLIETTRTFALSVEAPVQFARPSIDVLMESAACVYRDRCAGVVLTGANADGAEGLASIAAVGGLVVVQDPKTAEFKAMPEAAIAATKMPMVCTLGEIENLITTLGR